MELTRTLTLLLLLALSAAAQTPRIPPPESVNRNGLVGRWIVPGYQTGNGPTPTQTRDASGKGNHGTTVGSPNYDMIYAREAMAFNGTTKYVLVGTSNTLKLTGALSVSVWVYVPTTGLISEAGIVSRRVSSWLPINYQLAWEGVGAAGYIGFYVRGHHYGEATGSPKSGWHHIVGTWDGATRRIYLDGVLLGSNTSAGSDTSGDTQTLGIGGKPTYNNYGWSGGVYDARIYNRALTAAEISAIYRGLQ